MWAFITIIISVVITKFLYDRHKMLNSIDSNGGLIIKYKPLLDYMLSHRNAEISSRDKDHVNVICKGLGVTTYFSIIPSFDKVIIKWECIIGQLGNFSETWEFAEMKMSQEQMISVIERDIVLKSKSVFPDSILEIPSIKGKEIIEIEKKNSTLQLKNEIHAIQHQEKQTISTLLETAIIRPFLSLNVECQAKVLSMFIQIQHNNPYIDSYRNSFFILNIHNTYDQGYLYFLNFIKQNKDGIEKIKEFLESIRDIPEIFRLNAIIESAYGNTKEQENSFALSIKAWEKQNSKPMSYSFNILKTKADILINSDQHFEAATILEEGLSLLTNMEIENSSWLKYQYSKTLIELSKSIKINHDIQELGKQMKDYLENASMEETIQSLSINS